MSCWRELVRTIDLSLVTKATCYQIYDRLMLLNKALHIDGIHSAELEHHLDLLGSFHGNRGIQFHQYLDIYKGLSRAVKNIINDYFNNIHGENLTLIVSQLGPDQILEKYHSADTARDIEKLRHRVYEIFLRDRISMSLGLQQLDLFLGRILNTLYHQSRKLPKEQLRRLLNYDPQKAITSLQQANDLATGIIYLGNKGLNLLRLVNFGFSIPRDSSSPLKYSDIARLSNPLGRRGKISGTNCSGASNKSSKLPENDSEMQKTRCCYPFAAAHPSPSPA
jgi:pyruvate,orthophosphate dikinase